MSLETCTHCGMHHYVGEDECPHCNIAPRMRGAGKAMTATALLLGLTLGACGDKEGDPQPDYGVPMVDEDGDGHYADDGDCDDGNAEIHPDAEEICDDEIDNNCDGLIDEDDGCGNDSG